MKLNDVLPLAFRDAKAKYRLGITTPRWKKCNTLTDTAFTFVTTLLYVNKHLPEDARKTVIFFNFLHIFNPEIFEKLEISHVCKFPSSMISIAKLF